MRIAVHDYAGHSFTVELSRELARRGHDVLHLYSAAITSPHGSLTRGRDDPPTFAVEGIHLTTPIRRDRLFTRRRLEAEHGSRVVRRLRGFGPDVVISANAPLESQRRIARFCESAGAGFVFWVQDLIGEATARLLRRRLHGAEIPVVWHYRRLEQQLLEGADAVVVISADFLRHVPAGAEVIENWAPLADLPVREKRNDWAREQGLDATTTLLYAGTLGMKHDPSVLLDIAREAARHDARVVVVSEGFAADWLEEQAHHLPSRNLDVLPFQEFEALPDVLGAADVLIAILEPDAGVFSVPSKVLSYLCAARPLLLVVPPQNQAARLVAGAGAGIVTAPGDKAAIRSAIDRLLTDPTTREAMGRRGRAYAEQAFGLDAITTRFEDVLSRATSATGSRRVGPSRPGSDDAPPILGPLTTATAPTVSVVIVSYNGRDALGRCLASLDGERRLLAIEVIVVDNASADDAAGMVEEEYPWARLVRNTSNVGFAKAANTALGLARGEHVLLLNPDTIVPTGGIPALVDVLAERPEVGMLGCKLVQADGTFDHACKRGLPSVSSSFWYLIGLHRLFPRSPVFAAYVAGHVSEDAEGTVDAVNGAFMLLRREAVESVGGFDERFWLYGEDLDWCERFAEQGWQILYWPDVEVTHIKGGSGGSGRSRTWRANVAFHHSMWLYYDKHLAQGQPRPLSTLVWTGIWTRCLALGAIAGLRDKIGSRRQAEDRHGDSRHA